MGRYASKSMLINFSFSSSVIIVPQNITSPFLGTKIIQLTNVCTLNWKCIYRMKCVFCLKFLKILVYQCAFLYSESPYIISPFNTDLFCKVSASVVLMISHSGLTDGSRGSWFWLLFPSLLSTFCWQWTTVHSAGWSMISCWFHCCTRIH